MYYKHIGLVLLPEKLYKYNRTFLYQTFEDFSWKRTNKKKEV